MKYLKFLLLLISALLIMSCATLNGVYSDDIYYVPDVIILKLAKGEPKSKNITAIMQIEDNDTTINYLGDYEISYATRIKTFYSPYMYDPFWDPYWSIDYGLDFRFGFGYSSYYHYSYPYWVHSNFYTPWYYNYGYNYNQWYGYGGYGGYENHGGYDNHNNQKYKGKQDYRRGGGSNAVRYERKNDKNSNLTNTGRSYTPTSTSPSYNGSSTRQYSEPQKSSNTRIQSTPDSKSSIPTRGSYQQSTPTRNYTPSTPSRNFSAPSNISAPSNNYSAPSRSYSAPSPTFNSGGSGNSGGSTGTRGGRQQ